jgi:hypothetical protein
MYLMAFLVFHGLCLVTNSFVFFVVTQRLGYFRFRRHWALPFVKSPSSNQCQFWSTRIFLNDILSFLKPITVLFWSYLHQIFIESLKSWLTSWGLTRSIAVCNCLNIFGNYCRDIHPYIAITNFMTKDQS